MSNDILTLLLVRHGQSGANAKLTTDLDSALTPLGIEQAHRAAAWLAGHFRGTIEALYTSDLRRAQHTATIIGEALGQTPMPLPGFREIDRWEHEFLPLFESPSHAIGAPLGDEHAEYGLFRARIETSLRELVSRHAYGQVMLVSHGAVMGTMLRVMVGTPYLSISHQNTSITKLRWHRGRWHLDYVNRQEHLVGLEGYKV